MEPKPEFQGEDEVSSSAPKVESTVVTSTNTMDSLDEPLVESTVETDDHWEDHKVNAIIGYVLPVLFFLPLINESSKNSVYARFHSNQQLNLLVAGLVFYAVSGVIISILFGMGIGMIIASLIQLVPLLFLALAIIGILNASKGEMKELPVIGKYHLMK